jgi:hypothetical protein
MESKPTGISQFNNLPITRNGINNKKPKQKDLFDKPAQGDLSALSAMNQGQSNPGNNQSPIANQDQYLPQSNPTNTQVPTVNQDQNLLQSNPANTQTPETKQPALPELQNTNQDQQNPLNTQLPEIKQDKSPVETAPVKNSLPPLTSHNQDQDLKKLNEKTSQKIKNFFLSARTVYSTIGEYTQAGIIGSIKGGLLGSVVYGCLKAIDFTRTYKKSNVRKLPNPLVVGIAAIVGLAKLGTVLFDESLKIDQEKARFGDKTK